MTPNNDYLSTPYLIDYFLIITSTPEYEFPLSCTNRVTDDGAIVRR